MSDIVGVLGSLFPVLNSHPWAMAALIGVVVIAVAMWLAPRIIVATESLINIRSRLKDPDDWASEDSFLRTSDPVLWRQNLVFNRLRLDYLNSARVRNRIRGKEIPISAFLLPQLASLFVALCFFWISSMFSRSARIEPQGQSFHWFPLLFFTLVIPVLVVAFAALELVSLTVLSRIMDDEKVRNTEALCRYLQDSGFGNQVSKRVASCWYHFKVEHRDPPIALDERRVRTRTGVLLSFRVEHREDDGVALKDEYVAAMNDRRQVKCPTCGKRVWSYSWSRLFLKRLRWLKGRAKNNGTWTEQDVALALGVLSHLFSAQNVQKYLRRHESRLGHGGSAEAGAGGPEGAGGDGGAAGNGWFSRALRRQRQRRQLRSR